MVIQKVNYSVFDYLFDVTLALMSTPTNGVSAKILYRNKNKNGFKYPRAAIKMSA